MISFVLRFEHTSGWNNLIFDRHEGGECSMHIIGEDKNGESFQLDYSIREGETRELIKFLENSLQKEPVKD